MATISFFTWCGKIKCVKAAGLLMLVSVMAIGLVVGPPFQVQAEEKITTSTSPPANSQTSIEATQQLDQQLAAVPANLETDEMDQPEVQRLDETLVEGTYLDPFSDDANTEVIKDPWEPMNAKVFSFNLNVDRYVLKPVATGYGWLLPDPVGQAVGRAMTNIRFVPRTVNDLLQWKWENAGVEVGRFVINSTVGVAGLFDVAGDYLDLAPVPAEDFGQTLAMHGVQAGPYLVLPPSFSQRRFGMESVQ